ncbi:helix-turn-helix domain-containing protein [Microbacterium sp. W4I4]|uniref:helix-turn-helix domain-containing protein n=1 Tax=Microbacterium sp. W4I4 TaxID=3042295 RepID=UPI0027D91DD9|nr:helix-turn-helix domain-containing protein [Microbacterium sp. W4I4]
MLDEIDLDEEHLSVYRALLTLSSAGAAELAERSQVAVERVEVILDALERRGLAARRASDPDLLVASPPALALRPLLAERERRLAQAHGALSELSDLYREGAALRHAPDVVDVVRGADAVRQRIGQLQAAAAERVDVFVLSDVALMDSAANTEEGRALARGVEYRVVVEADVLERPGFLDAAREAYAYGEEVRVLPTLPTRLFLVDGELALLPTYSRNEGNVTGALLVHPSGLLDLVTAMFEQYWRMATTLVDEAMESREVEQGVDHALLKLLLLGMTDSAAAAQLGISVRTVQRRVAELMDHAGVSTRLQLGAGAVRLGWV